MLCQMTILKMPFRIISGDFVTTEDGTGIVHTAPTFGADDAISCQTSNTRNSAIIGKDADDNLVPLWIYKADSDLKWESLQDVC